MRILKIIDSKEKNISMLFEPEENKSILPMKNLDIQNEKVEEIIPLSDKSDRINLMIHLTILIIYLKFYQRLNILKIK